MGGMMDKRALAWFHGSVPSSQPNTPNSFMPSYRGRILSGPPLDLTRVRRIAFLLADGNPGEFSLEVDWIGLKW